MVGHTFEYNPAVRKLRELVHGRDLGELYYLDSARLNLGLYQDDVNVIVDLAPHDISIVNYVLGREPVAVQAWAARHAHRPVRGRRVPSPRSTTTFSRRGLSANIHVSWLDPCKVRRITAVGRKKMAVYDDLAAEERIRILDKGVCLPPDGGNQTPASRCRTGTGDIVVPFVVAGRATRRAGPPLRRAASTSGAAPLTDGDERSRGGRGAGGGAAVACAGRRPVLDRRGASQRPPTAAVRPAGNAGHAHGLAPPRRQDHSWPTVPSSP